MKTSWQKLKTENGYNFWTLNSSNGIKLWNITPEDQEAPTGGYQDKETIEKIKHQTF